MKREYIDNFKIVDLKPYEKNAKMHPRKQIDKIKNSFSAFGVIAPVIIDENNELIAGHGRLLAAKELKLLELPALKVKGLSENEKKAYRLADNQISELGEWNVELLDQELKDLKLSGFDVDLTGFDYEIKENVEDIKEDDFEEPEIDMIKTIIKEGDIFEIGPVRIACGSATDRELVAKLLQSRKIDMVFTDPPYGVSYKGTNNPNGKEWDVIKGDNLRGDALYDLLVGSFKVISEFGTEKIPVYSCYASKNHYQFEKALNDAGFKVKQQIIWHKHHVLGHSDYHWTHEPILYCSRLENNCNYYGDRREKTCIMESKLEDLHEKSKEELMEIIELIKEQSTIWSIRKDSPSLYVHPTQKPIKLPARAIINSSNAGDQLYEPFGGSGSTIIAAIQTSRNIVSTELDPRYVQVILQRIKNFKPEWEVKCLNRKITEKDLFN